MRSPVRVMLVDDSAVVRGLIQRALSADPAIALVGSVMNGEMAVAMLRYTPTDVVILDVEMPIMDGLTALPKLLEIAPGVRVIMSSTLTLRNAEVSLKAMALGAADYIAKPSSREENETAEFYKQLIAKIKALAPVTDATANALTEAARVLPALPPSIVPLAQPPRQLTHLPPMQALAIASSTGGPQALLELFKGLKGTTLRVPVFISQHMPPDFTTILARHISEASGMDCREATDGEAVTPGRIYVAPGNYHMTATCTGTGVTLHLDQNPPENFCRPAADPMLRSLAKCYGKKLLVAVLTGIGSDGTRGAGEVVAAGGIVIAQDEASSVVYGMPKSVREANMTSAVLPLSAMADFMREAI